MTISRRSVLAGAAAAPALAAIASSTASAAQPRSATAPAHRAAPDRGFRVGVGLSDMTGPVAENGMMGYSQFDQRAEGLHQRTRVRAYVFADADDNRVVYTCADTCMVFQAVHDAVLARLAAKYGDLYTEKNVMLTAVHSHAACGGASQDYAYSLATLGFQPQVFDAEVDGVVEAIVAAHDNLAAGTVAYGRSELKDASVNRSRAAFDRNPQGDKDYYPLGIDTAMRVLRISQGGDNVGGIGWFPTHGASLTNKNHLISGDNKGAAAYFWEHDVAGVRYLDGKPGFVACFPQTNTGDMSPNLDLKPGHGPTADEFENTRIIGERQVAAAREAFRKATPLASTTVDSRMMYLTWRTRWWTASTPPTVRSVATAPACVGAAMAAGSTEDGPAIEIFTEGTTRNPMLDALSGIDPPHPCQWAVPTPQAPKAGAGARGPAAPDGWVPHVLRSRSSAS
ncbi:alkaline ceramidase, partial [Rhodococcus hoagii]|nr:alkaline ceramidase [Prescottella equi]